MNGPSRTPAEVEPTWSNAPKRFPPGRFVLFEPVGLAVHDWSRPQPGRPRMFDLDFLEWFSHIHPASLVAIYVPSSLFFLWKAIQAGLSPPIVALLLAAGWFFWTLVEYLIHRFSFHYVPRGPIGMFYAYTIHGVHHAFPEDDRRWLVPPILSVIVSAGFYFVLTRVFGAYGLALLAGGLAGYLVYDLMHYAIHRGRSRFGVVNRLRQHHLQHHYATPEGWYGVSTPLWDYVFGTASSPSSADGRRG